MYGIELAIFFQFFIGLFAAVNPLGIMPIFVSLTAHQNPIDRGKTAYIASIAFFIIIVVSLLAGQILLDVFSISLNSFRIAGGLLLLSIAFTMMSGKLGEEKQTKKSNQNQQAASK